MKINKTFFILILFIIILFGLYHFVFKASETKNLESEYPKEDFIELNFVELNLEVYKENIGQDEHTQKFSRPILYYLVHPNSSPIFVIVDFKRGEITYLNIHTPDDIKGSEENPILKQLQLFKKYPLHSSVVIEPEEDFYTFPLCLDTLPICDQFYYINIKNKTAKIITPKDLANSFFGPFSKKHDDPNTLYMVLRLKTDEGYKLNYYQSNLDLSNIKKIYETSSEKFIADPHNLLDYKNKLLTTNFGQTKIKLTDRGLEFDSLEEYYNFVIKDTFKRENPSGNEQDAEAYFKQKYGNMTFKDFKKFCLENNKYKFEILPGTIRILDLLSKREEKYNTISSNAAHFEIDNKEGFIYVSAHSLDNFGTKYVMLGPASIDKFKLENGKLIHMGAFVDPKGYRFTSHRFFRYENKPYIVTFSYPNRMFIIDGETMTLLFSQDIGNDFLSGNEEINDLATPEIDNMNVRITAMEVSDDGSLILFFLGDYIYLYDFPQRKIVKKIEYKKNITLTNGEKLKDFLPSKDHSNYLA